MFGVVKNHRRKSLKSRVKIEMNFEDFEEIHEFEKVKLGGRESEGQMSSAFLVFPPTNKAQTQQKV
jgi:hypothetical protein